MTDTKAERLTAEEEVVARAVMARRGDVVIPIFPAGACDDFCLSFGRLFATLDASRVEIEAVRRERDEAHAAFIEESTDLVNVAAEREALRSLAAELVEGLEGFNLKPGMVVTGSADTLTVCVPLAAIQRAAAAVVRARAQGIGEKEKGNG